MKNIYFCTLIFCSGIAFFNKVRGQAPQKYFNSDSITEQYYSTLKKEFGNKTIPAAIEKPILLALSYYPELKNTPIRFRIRKRHTPLQTRSTWTGLFERKEIRDYIITISDSTESLLTPLLLKNVPFNAQIGAAGHELAHVADFSGFSFIHIL